MRLRPGTTDGTVVWATFAEEYHLPPDEVAPASIANILDLGANIGLTVAHFGVLYPHARVRGFELHPPTAEIARRNIEPWSDRCSITTGAVWHSDGTVPYTFEAGHESGNRIDAAAGGSSESPAMSLDSIIGAESIDYIKMDVEGAERELLRINTSWSKQVRAMKIEVHEPYSVQECLDDVTALGFRAVRDTKHHAAVTAVRAP